LIVVKKDDLPEVKSRKGQRENAKLFLNKNRARPWGLRPKERCWRQVWDLRLAQGSSLEKKKGFEKMPLSLTLYSRLRTLNPWSN